MFLALIDAIDPETLLETFGLVGLFAIIFAETGLLIGFFLPGDSLLIFGGLVAAVGEDSAFEVEVNLGVLLVGVFLAAVIGAQVGYYIGRAAGPALFRRPESRLFKVEYVEKAQHYFDRYGPKTVVAARFIPIVRTFANPMAGVARMDPRSFAFYNVVGAALWAFGLTMVGYALGKWIPSAEDHLLLIEGVVIFLSLVPIGLEYRKSRREKASRAAAETSVGGE